MMVVMPLGAQKCELLNADPHAFSGLNINRIWKLKIYMSIRVHSVLARVTASSNRPDGAS